MMNLNMVNKYKIITNYNNLLSIEEDEEEEEEDDDEEEEEEDEEMAEVDAIIEKLLSVKG